MADLVDLQGATDQPGATGVQTGSNLLLPPVRTAELLSHFPEEVYSLAAESHLARFVKVLIGDAGVGQLRKRLLVSRLQQTIQGTHFYDLDRFYGGLFGVRRSLSEVLDLDPYTQSATSAEWSRQHAKDASYRSRVGQFARAISYGATPTGMELVAEALLAVDCDVHEAFIQADASYQTNAEIEAQYGNKLSADNSSFETSLGNWSATGNSTIARSTTVGLVGTSSLALTATAIGAAFAEVATAGRVLVGPGQTIIATGSVRAASGGAPCRLFLRFFDSAGTALTSTGSPALTPTGTDWVRLETSAVAPAAAATASVYLEVAATVAGQVHHLDDVVVFLSIEGVSYGTLEGVGLGRLSGDERREFIIRPKRPITAGEAYDLSKVLNRLKPADARFSIDLGGSDTYDASTIRSAAADSNFWEIIPKVLPAPNSAAPYRSVQAGVALEQPRPPFSAYQGEAWSYIGDVLGVTSTIPTQAIGLADGTYLNYPVQEALLPRRQILAGRAISDGVLVSHPYWASSPRTFPDLAPLYTDRIALDRVNAALTNSPLIDTLPTSPAERYWATPERLKSDPTPESMELRLTATRLVNHISFEVAHYPHRVTVQSQEVEGSQWVTLGSTEVTDSIPAYLPPGIEPVGHPQHSQGNHWVPVRMPIEPTQMVRLRLVLSRLEGAAPVIAPGREVPYSLAVRSLDLGYRVRRLSDVPVALQSGGVIGLTTDPLGSTIEFSLRRETAPLMLTTDQVWRCEPQPVNYAVVNFYLDVRETGTNDSTVIDRFYLEPTHSGAHVTVYWSQAVGEPGTGTDWYDSLAWTPIPRDYTLQKGFLHIPPTRARHFKFEFTGLTAEPFETLLPLARTVRLFPAALVSRFSEQTSTALEAYPSGVQSAMQIATVARYADALEDLGRDTRVNEVRDTTEAVYAQNPVVSEQLRQQSFAYGFQPWHQGSSAPRFTQTQVHRYESIEVRHTTKVGFFVGLADIKAYRLDNAANDDTQAYVEHFNDFRNIAASTWTFNPNVISTELSSTSVATSKVHGSLNNVKALQFATQQSDPYQVAPNDDFRDPAMATSEFTADDDWHRVGDALLVYSEADHSIVVVRYSQPLQRALLRTPGLVQRPVQPTFGYRTAAFTDTVATGEQRGGLESPPLGVSGTGRAYAATRVTLLSPLTQPLRLQITDNTAGRTVLAETFVNGKVGEILEVVLPYDLQGQTGLRLRLIQTADSNDQFKVDTLSLFDEGIVWEFSVNGGTDWVPAVGVRNNANGIVTFPEPGNQLVWRVKGVRPFMAISSLQIRPHYVGVPNARETSAQRGPNVSTYDAALPITQDPQFTDWTKPVPRYWFSAFKRFPLVPPSGGPNITAFQRFYGRPTSDSVAAPTDNGASRVTAIRTGTDRVDFFNPISDAVTRVGTLFKRSGAETLATPTDAAAPVTTKPIGGGVVNIPSHPTF